MPRWPAITPLERALTHVDATGDCWQWTGTLNRADGYGTFRVGTQMVLAHRFIWSVLVGPIPSGLHLDHLCHVPSCVNPDHLEPVTQAENNRRSPHFAWRLSQRRARHYLATA